MGIFGRISDIISANINDMLDKAENPEKMVKLMVTEMEESLREVRVGVAKAIANEKKLQKDLEQQRKLATGWEEKAKMAIEHDDDNLARRALARKKEHDSAAASIEPLLETASKDAERLRDHLRKLEAKLQDARRKRDSLIARHRAAQAQQEVRKSAATIGDAGSDAFSKFERFQEKVEDLEAQSEAMVELVIGEGALEDEFEKLEENDDVEAELLKLKEKMKPAKPEGS